MKKHIGQNIRILITGLCVLLLLVATILSAIPEADLGVKVSEAMEVSWSRISMNEELYACEIEGILKNTGDETILIDRLEILVGNGKEEHLLTQEGITLPARTAHEIFLRWEDEKAYDRVLSVKITANGETATLANLTEGGSVNGLTVLLGALCLLCAYLLVRAVRIRLYMEEEDRHREQDSATA